MLCHYNCAVTVLLLMTINLHKEVSDITDSSYKLEKNDGKFILVALVNAAAISLVVFLYHQMYHYLNILKFPGNTVV